MPKNSTNAGKRPAIKLTYHLGSKAQRYRIQPHHHDACELAIFANFAGRFSYDRSEMDFAPGQMIFLPPQTVHSIVTEPSTVESFILHFTPQTIPTINPGLGVPAVTQVATPSSEDLATALNMLRWVEQAESTNSIATTSVLESVLAIYFEKVCTYEGSSVRTTAFQRLEQHLNDHSIYTLSVDDAAALSNLSRSHFMAKFKQTYGVTFNRYMLQRKISAAKVLLRTGELSATEISHQLELNNASYFGKLFKQEVGCTPKAYTRLHTRDLF